MLALARCKLHACTQSVQQQQQQKPPLANLHLIKPCILLEWLRRAVVPGHTPEAPPSVAAAASAGSCADSGPHRHAALKQCARRFHACLPSLGFRQSKAALLKPVVCVGQSIGGCGEARRRR